MDYITLYSTGCPMRKVLKKKLDMAGITYTVVEDINEMSAMGMKSAPALQVNCGPLMNFKEADKWIREQTNG